MATMKTLNGYGFNATELNGKTSDNYLLRTDTVANSADSQKLGGKAPKYYIQPRNLLDNSDFRNPVNQRGITSETSISAYSHFIDRWVNQTSEARSFTLSTSGIGLPLPTTILQRIENVAEGTVLTFSIKLLDGTIATLTGTVQYASDGAWMRFASISHSFGDMYMETQQGFVNVVVYNMEAVTIRWAALYEGSYTADTLPPYVPKEAHVEKANCGYRFIRIGSDMYTPIGMAQADNVTSLNCLIPLPYAINTDAAPTITLEGIMTARSAGNYIDINKIEMNSYGEYQITVWLNGINFEVGKAYDVFLQPGAHLNISRDL